MSEQELKAAVTSRMVPHQDFYLVVLSLWKGFFFFLFLILSPSDWWVVAEKGGRGLVRVRAERLGKIIFLHAWLGLSVKKGTQLRAGGRWQIKAASFLTDLPCVWPEWGKAGEGTMRVTSRKTIPEHLHRALVK